ncbi:Vacuolar protein sorting-associated protein 2 homolog 3 [Linum perenne]
MRGIATHTQTLYAQSSVATGLKGATKAMATMNKQMDPAKQAKVMMEFQKQSAQMDMTVSRGSLPHHTEMMSETIDEVLDDDEAEEETEDLTNQVLDEIGVDVASQLSSAPKQKIAGKKEDVSSSSRINELEERLAALRNP